MDLLDLVILLLALAIAVRGLKIGFFRQVGSFGGFVVGLIAGAAIAPIVASVVSDPMGHMAIGLIILFGLATLASGLGESAGISLGAIAGRWKLGWADKTGGALFGACAVLFSAWLLSSMFSRVLSISLATQIQNSTILRNLDAKLPPAPDFIARVERLITPSGFPRVFAGLEPNPAPPVTGPNVAAINQAIAAGKASTVEIEGSGCGVIVEGTGFVIGPDLVGTNAHVVAGIRASSVMDGNGTHRAVVVSFDPNLDFAVLRVTGLAGPILPLDPNDEPRGSIGAVLGFPGGGPFTASSAAILDKQTALGRNIYDTGIVSRDIYELQTTVRPGNSGGPLISPDGTVFGVVFATSTTNDNVGYALTSREVIREATQASSSGAVGTGPCMQE